MLISEPLRFAHSAKVSLGGFTSYYQDTGCEFSSRCQDCPRPRCRYDYSASRSMRFEQRNEDIHQAYLAGMQAYQICQQFSLTKRQVWRILSEVRGDS